MKGRAGLLLRVRGRFVSWCRDQEHDRRAACDSNDTHGLTVQANGRPVVFLSRVFAAVGARPDRLPEQRDGVWFRAALSSCSRSWGTLWSLTLTARGAWRRLAQQARGPRSPLFTDERQCGERRQGDPGWSTRTPCRRSWRGVCAQVSPGPAKGLHAWEVTVLPLTWALFSAS